MITLRNNGFTLIEVIISLALGLVLLLGLSSLFVQNNRSYKQNEAQMALQDQARFALSTLSRDLQMAGYWGGMSMGSQILPSSTINGAVSAANDCGADSSSWALTTSKRVEYFNWTLNAQASSKFKCLSNVQAGTDVLAVRRVAGQEAASITACGDVTLADKTFYLKTNGVEGSLIRTSGTSYTEACTTDAPITAPMSFFKLVPRLYYVRNYAKLAGDGIPTLCRRELQHAATPKLEEECLAEGVEDFQIVWGIDGNKADDPTFTPNHYTTSPTDAELARAVSAEVFLLMRAAKGDASNPEDENIYSYADKTSAFEKTTGGAYDPKNIDQDENTPEAKKLTRFSRRVFSTTVQIRNPLPSN